MTHHSETLPSVDFELYDLMIVIFQPARQRSEVLSATVASRSTRTSS